MKKTLEATLRVTAIYAIFAACWILFSDMAVEAISSEIRDITILQTLKGWAFVAVTALLLFILILKSHQRVERAFQLDGLTGLLNHTMFKQQLVRKISDCRDDQIVAIWYLDIDNFKQLNEKEGFDKADQFLLALAQDLEKTFRADTIIGRLTADQFALSRALYRTDSLEEKTLELKRIFTQCAFRSSLDIFCSIGVATYPGDAKSASDLMSAANDALRSAKQQRDNIIYHDASLAIASKKRRELLKDLQSALAEGQLSLAYQPKYSIATGEPTGVEILTRWNHPFRGLISPAEFIPLAEQNNLSHKITQYVIKTAAAELEASQLLGNPIKNVAINVSATEFNCPKEMDSLLEHILQFNHLAPYIKIEITETATLTDMHRSAIIINKLREHGIRFSIDDFGTGYTSLAMLKDFTIDEIKIDRSFIAELEHQDKAKTIVAAIVAMASRFNINVVAEGVETAGQLSLLQSTECKEAQGYLLGAPMPLERLKSHLSAPRNSIFSTATDSGLSENL